jgi:hypothetical protein
MRNGAANNPTQVQKQDLNGARASQRELVRHPSEQYRLSLSKPRAGNKTLLATPKLGFASFSVAI